MDASLKRKFAGAAAGVALLAGAGGAIAASNGGGGPRADDRDAFMNDVAKRLHVTPQELKDAFLGALSDRLDADVKAGRLTRAQADEILKHAREDDHGGPPFGFGFHGPPPPGAPPGAPPPLPGPPPPGGRFYGPPGMPPGPGVPGPIGAGFSGAADYLGLTEKQLRQKLESGKSLAQVAGDESKSVDGLKSAIEAAVKKDLDKAVADKRLTQKQADDMLAGLHDRLDDIVNRRPGDRPPRPPRFRHRGHW